MDAAFSTALDAFVAGCQALIDADYASNYPNTVEAGGVPKLTIDPNGQRYIRIVSQRPHQQLVWAFVAAEDVTTKGLTFAKGDVAKPASWKVPAKHPRGNILEPDNGLNAVTAHGVKYLK